MLPDTEAEDLLKELARSRAEVAWWRQRFEMEQRRSDLWKRRATSSVLDTKIGLLTRLIGKLQDEIEARDTVLRVAQAAKKPRRQIKSGVTHPAPDVQ